ncbi:hypothetical protein PCH70_39290 [Pseudomonas cichorii JBC1]|nr:hypothetical protein PCH70_39290 [Pseudomonas cichorii JBC1]
MARAVYRIDLSVSHEKPEPWLGFFLYGVTTPGSFCCT